MAAPQRVSGLRADVSTLPSPCHTPVWPSILHTAIGVDEDDDSVELPSTVDTKAIHDSPPHLSSQPVCIPRFHSFPPDIVQSDESDDDSPRSSSSSSLHSSNSSSLSSSSSSSASSLSSLSSSSSSCSSSSSSSGTDEDNDDGHDRPVTYLSRYQGPAAYPTPPAAATSVASSLPSTSTTLSTIRPPHSNNNNIDPERALAVVTSGRPMTSSTSSVRFSSRPEPLSSPSSTSSTRKKTGVICSADSSVTSSTSSTSRRERCDAVTSGAARSVGSPLSDRGVDSPASSGVTSSSVCAQPIASFSSRSFSQLDVDRRGANDEITSTVDDIESTGVCRAVDADSSSSSSEEREFEVMLCESVDAAIRRLDGDELFDSAVNSTVRVKRPIATSSTPAQRSVAAASPPRPLQRPRDQQSELPAASNGDRQQQKLSRRLVAAAGGGGDRRTHHSLSSRHCLTQQQQQQQQEERQNRAKQTWWRNRINRRSGVVSRLSPSVSATRDVSAEREMLAGDASSAAVANVVRPWESRRDAEKAISTVRCSNTTVNNKAASTLPSSTSVRGSNSVSAPNSRALSVSSISTVNSSSSSGKFGAYNKSTADSAVADNNRSNRKSLVGLLDGDLERSTQRVLKKPRERSSRGRKAASKSSHSTSVRDDVCYERSNVDGCADNKIADRREKNSTSCSINQQQQCNDRQQRRRRMAHGRRSRRTIKASATAANTASSTAYRHTKRQSTGVACDEPVSASTKLAPVPIRSSSAGPGSTGLAVGAGTPAGSDRIVPAHHQRKLSLSEILNRENKNSVLRSAALQASSGINSSRGSLSLSGIDVALGVDHGEYYCGQLKLPASPSESDTEISSDCCCSETDTSESVASDVDGIDGVDVAGTGGAICRRPRALSGGASALGTRVPRLRAVPVPVLRSDVDESSGGHCVDKLSKPTALSNSGDFGAISQIATTTYTSTATASTSGCSDGGRDCRNLSQDTAKPDARPPDCTTQSPTSASRLVSALPLQQYPPIASVASKISTDTLNRLKQQQQQRQRLRQLRGRRKNIVDPVLLADVEELVQRLYRLLIGSVTSPGGVSAPSGDRISQETSPKCFGDSATVAFGSTRFSPPPLPSIFSLRRFGRGGRRRQSGDQREGGSRRRRAADRDNVSRRRCKPTSVQEGESKEQCLPLKKRNHSFTASSAVESSRCHSLSLMGTEEANLLPSSPDRQSTDQSRTELLAGSPNCMTVSAAVPSVCFSAGVGSRRGRSRSVQDKTAVLPASAVSEPGSLSGSATAAAVVSSLHRRLSSAVGAPSGSAREQAGSAGARLQRRWRLKRRLRRSPAAAVRRAVRRRRGVVATVAVGEEEGAGSGDGDDKRELSQVFGGTGGCDDVPSVPDCSTTCAGSIVARSVPAFCSGAKFGSMSSVATCADAHLLSTTLRPVKEELDTSGDVFRKVVDNFVSGNAEQVVEKRVDLRSSPDSAPVIDERLPGISSKPAISSGDDASVCGSQPDSDTAGSNPNCANVSQCAISSVSIATTTTTATTAGSQQFVFAEVSVASPCSTNLSQPVPTVSTDKHQQVVPKLHDGTTTNNNNNNSSSSSKFDSLGEQQQASLRRRRRRKANRTGFPSSKRRRCVSKITLGGVGAALVSAADADLSPLTPGSITSAREISHPISASPTSSTVESAEVNGGVSAAVGGGLVTADSIEVVQDSTVSSAQLTPVGQPDHDLCQVVSAPSVLTQSSRDLSIIGDASCIAESSLLRGSVVDDSLPCSSPGGATISTTDQASAATDNVKDEEVNSVMDCDPVDDEILHRSSTSKKLPLSTDYTLSVLLSDDASADGEDAILPDAIGPPNDQLLLLREHELCASDRPRWSAARSAESADSGVGESAVTSARYSRSNKKYIVAGLLSSYYKHDSSDVRLDQVRSSSCSSVDRSRSLLPPPCHEERWLRRRRRDFTLPHDLWRLQRRCRATARVGCASWNYRKLRANLYYDVKPPSFRVAEPCTCIPPPPSSTSATTSGDCALDDVTTAPPITTSGTSGSDNKPRRPVGCADDCINRMMYVECSAAVCACGEECQNQRIQRHQWPPALVKVMTPDKGWGVITQLPIRAGTAILEYLGEIVSEKEFKRRMQTRYSVDEHHYCLNLDRGLVIDAHRVGSLARFVNHSCAPNCEIQKWEVNGQYRMVLFALDDIDACSELCYDYNFSLFDPAVGQVCRCGASECRGVIGGRTQRVSQPPSSVFPSSASSSALSSSSPSMVVTCKLAPGARSSRHTAAKRLAPVRNRRLPWFPGAELTGPAGGRPSSARELKLARAHCVFLVRNYRHMRHARTRRSTTGTISPLTSSHPSRSSSSTTSGVLNNACTVSPSSGGGGVTPEQFRLHLRSMNECGADESVRTRAALAQLSDRQLVRQLEVAQLLLQLMKCTLLPPDGVSDSSLISRECLSPDQSQLSAEQLAVPISSCPSMALSPHLPPPLSLADIERQLYSGTFSSSPPGEATGAADCISGVELFDYHVRRLFSHQLLRATGCAAATATAALTAARRRYTATKQLMCERFRQVLGYVPVGFRATAAKRHHDNARLDGEEDVVRCVCNLCREEGVMIQCERCLVWQHCMCVGADSSVENYLCEQCDVRYIDPEILLQPQPEEATPTQPHYLSLMRDTLQIRQGDCVYVMQGKQVKAAEKAGQLPYLYAEQLQLSPDQLLIFCVEKLWKDERGERYAFGYHYCRPHETYHEPTRRFYPSEVLRSPLHELVPLRLIVAKCWVLDLNSYCKGRPVGSAEEHVYVCELRVDKHARAFSRLARGARRALCTRWFAFDTFATRLRPAKTLVAHEAETSQTLSEHAARQAAKRAVSSQVAPSAGFTDESQAQSVAAGRRRKAAGGQETPVLAQAGMNNARRRKNSNARTRQNKCDRLDNILTRLLTSLPSPPVGLSSLVDPDRKSRRRGLASLRHHFKGAATHK